MRATKETSMRYRADRNSRIHSIPFLRRDVKALLWSPQSSRIVATAIV